MGEGLLEALSEGALSWAQLALAKTAHGRGEEVRGHRGLKTRATVPESLI